MPGKCALAYHNNGNPRERSFTRLQNASLKRSTCRCCLASNWLNRDCSASVSEWPCRPALDGFGRENTPLVVDTERTAGPPRLLERSDCSWAGVVVTGAWMGKKGGIACPPRGKPGTPEAAAAAEQP